MRIRRGSVSWVACRRRDADAVADATGEGCEAGAARSARRERARGGKPAAVGGGGGLPGRFWLATPPKDCGGFDTSRLRSSSIFSKDVERTRGRTRSGRLSRLEGEQACNKGGGGRAVVVWEVGGRAESNDTPSPQPPRPPRAASTDTPPPQPPPPPRSRPPTLRASRSLLSPPSLGASQGARGARGSAGAGFDFRRPPALSPPPPPG